MKTSQSIAEITKALIAFDLEKPVVKKNKKANFEKYSIEYADLESILSEVRPLLSKHNLRLTHTFDGSVSEAIISHISGEYITSSLSMPQTNNDPKATGALISYYRRYQLNAILGLAADDADTDLMETPKAQVRPVQSTPRQVAPIIPGKIPPCPKCGGVMEDVRATKKTPKHPDFICKDVNCKTDKGYRTGSYLPKTSQQALRSRYEEPADGLPTVKHDQWQATQNLAEASHVEDDGIDQMTNVPF